MANSSYITILKRNVKNEIINDPLIVKVFGSPDYDPKDPEFSGDDVAENYIYTWNQLPGTTTDEITFLTIQVHIQKAFDYYRNTNNLWVIPTLEIYIYSHNDHMNLSGRDFPGIAANRNDYLSQLIDDKFNGRTSFGEGTENQILLMNELTLTTNEEGILNNKFAFRHMIFTTKDTNAALCAR